MYVPTYTILFYAGYAHDAQLNVMKCLHCGLVGHRGVAATSSMEIKKFKWKNLKADYEAFVQQILHCMTAESGNKIRCPFSSTVHG